MLKLKSIKENDVVLGHPYIDRKNNSLLFLFANLKRFTNSQVYAQKCTFEKSRNHLFTRQNIILNFC